jgi:hypothetical protein
MHHIYVRLLESSSCRQVSDRLEVKNFLLFAEQVFCRIFCSVYKGFRCLMHAYEMLFSNFVLRNKEIFLCGIMYWIHEG